MQSLTRQTFIAGLTLAALDVPAAAFAQGAAKVGAPAPAFQAVDVEGKTRNLSEFAGKTVILEWTNHDCPYVRKHYLPGNMQAQQREAAAKGVVWLSLVASGPGRQGYVEGLEANELTKSRNAAPAAVLLDPQGVIARAYGAQTTPHMYVIDAGGTLVYKGAIDSVRSSNPEDVPRAKQYVRQALEEVLAGKKVSEPSTRPYG